MYKKTTLRKRKSLYKTNIKQYCKHCNIVKTKIRGNLEELLNRTSDKELTKNRKSGMSLLTIV